MVRVTATARARAKAHVVRGAGECRLLRVEARLRHGLPAGHLWFPHPLDGILASAARRRRLGGSYGIAVDHHAEPLPLAGTARTGRAHGLHGWDDQRWVWAASCAQWGSDLGERDTRWKHKRPWSQLQAESVGITGDRVPANPDAGAFKAQRIPKSIIPVLDVWWWAIGDRSEVEDLLGSVAAIGDDHNIGEGVVARWTVTDDGDPDWERVWWGDDGRVARPVPARHAEHLGVPGCETVLVESYRPPYWRAMPTSAPGAFRRDAVEVIAPWTMRP